MVCPGARRTRSGVAGWGMSLGTDSDPVRRASLGKHRTAVHVAARGVVCAFGLGEEALFRGLLSGSSGVGLIDEHPLSDGGIQATHAQAQAATMDGASEAPGSLPLKGARVPEALVASSRETEQTLALLELAWRQIEEDPAWSAVDPRALGVAVGTTQGTIARWSQHQEALALDPRHVPAWPVISEPAAWLARRVGAGGPVETPSLACASGTAAVGLGLSWIRRGLCQAVVAGGVDIFSPFVFHGFRALKALDPDRPRPFDAARAGLALGEGAALLLLTGDPSETGVQVLGFGLGADANHLTGPDPRGLGLSRAITSALFDAGLGPSDLDHVNAHGTATRYNDLMESKAFAHALGAHAAQVPVNSIKGAIGHTLGAAGAIEAVYAMGVMQRGLVPPTIGLLQPDPEIPLNLVHGPNPLVGGYRRVLSTSSGFGGLNAALVLGEPL